MILCPDEHCVINLHQVNNFTLFQNVKESGKEIRVDYSLDTREDLIELFQPFYKLLQLLFHFSFYLTVKI